MSAKYSIDKGVPLPRSGRRPNAPYPWDGMEVGDSFFVPKGNRTTVAGRASYNGVRLSRKFIARQEGDGVRVWRIA